jgi:hypothetical protein
VTAGIIVNIIPPLLVDDVLVAGFSWVPGDVSQNEEGLFQSATNFVASYSAYLILEQKYS